MRTFVFACLLLAVFCDEMHFFHYKDGEMKIQGEQPAKISGPIFIEFLKTINVTTIAGMHIKGSTETPFALGAKITKVIRDGDKITVEAACFEAGWGTKPMKMEGTVNVTGTWNEIHYHAHCENKETKARWEINAHATATKCPLYAPAEAGARAKILVGQHAEVFQAVHVLNYAIIGYPYVNGIRNCTWYLQNFKNATDAKPGFAIVGNDGAHCGIIDKEGDKFIHTNPVKKLVTETPLSMAKDFFKKGYTLKDYTC